MLKTSAWGASDRWFESSHPDNAGKKDLHSVVSLFLWEHDKFATISLLQQDILMRLISLFKPVGCLTDTFCKIIQCIF